MSWYKRAMEYPMEDPPLYGDSDYKSRGGVITRMSPDEFLALCSPLDIDESSRENIDELKRTMGLGSMDSPVLYYRDGKVLTHDGRHRANAAKEMGMNTIPVLEINV